MPCVFVSSPDRLIRIYWLMEVVLAGREPWRPTDLWVQLNGLASVAEAGCSLVFSHRGAIREVENLTAEWSSALHADDGDWFARFLNDKRRGLGERYAVAQNGDGQAMMVVTAGAGEVRRSAECGPTSASAVSDPHAYCPADDEAEPFFSTFKLTFDRKGDQLFRVAFHTDFGITATKARYWFDTHGPDAAFDRVWRRVEAEKEAADKQADQRRLACSLAAQEALAELDGGRALDKYDLVVLAHPTFILDEEQDPEGAPEPFTNAAIGYAPFVAGSDAPYYAHDMKNNTRFHFTYYVTPPLFRPARGWLSELADHNPTEPHYNST